MKLYLLERKTMLRASAAETWSFFSNPVNLAKITPPDMRFTVVSQNLPEEIYSGQLIEYRVRPLLGIPLRWTTEIKEVERLRCFVDEQLKGPYRYWRHEHIFTRGDEGFVLMYDRLQYALPFGWLGRLGALHLVQQKLQSLFQFRYKAIQTFYPGSKAIT